VVVIPNPLQAGAGGGSAGDRQGGGKGGGLAAAGAGATGAATGGVVRVNVTSMEKCAAPALDDAALTSASVCVTGTSTAAMQAKFTAAGGRVGGH
jgi:hypothetical protein